MSRKYQIGRTRKSRGRKVFGVFVTALVIVGLIGGVLAWDTKRNSQQTEVVGESRSVQQSEDVKSAAVANIDEQLYSFNLPPDWKKKETTNAPTERSITWQATTKGQDNRWIKVYTDVIPANLAVNRLLPVDVVDNGISHRQTSDNCVNFTPKPTTPGQSTQPSKWQNVDFICDTGNFVQNKVGVAAPVPGKVNTIELTGTKGKHTYFIMYTDHNIQPDYQILYNALKSFKAK